MASEDANDETRPLLSPPPISKAAGETSQVPYALLKFIIAIIGKNWLKRPAAGILLCMLNSLRRIPRQCGYLACHSNVPNNCV